ncbi:hypothetical protein AC249_AIPGENE14027 [Exaiptasia diaphana]|nr:hypothetical protein AC249_AIPGENE14027 [Exaiptasia diaphana]
MSSQKQNLQKALTIESCSSTSTLSSIKRLGLKKKIARLVQTRSATSLHEKKLIDDKNGWLSHRYQA